MNLPDVIRELVDKQNGHDSAGYAGCFSETAIVTDEGKTYNGRPAIKGWSEKTNRETHPVMKPLEYQELGKQNILLAEVSGNFNGSPIVLKFHHTIENNLIQTLNITA